jgi:hypothetical protein
MLRARAVRSRKEFIDAQSHGEHRFDFPPILGQHATQRGFRVIHQVDRERAVPLRQGKPSREPWMPEPRA